MDRLLKSFKVEDYILHFYYKPALWMTEEELLDLHEKVKYVNTISNKNFNYGIFDKTKSINKFYSEILICLMELNGETVGFQYQVIYDNAKMPLVHQGLVVIAKNTGVDLIGIEAQIAAVLIREIIGDYYSTTISSIPAVLEKFYNIFEEIWPSPYVSNLGRSCKSYREILKFLFDNYVKDYFPLNEEHELHEKRFVIEFKVQENGFETDLRKMPRSEDFLINNFCMFWLDYSKNETVILVGKFSQESFLKTVAKLKKYAKEKELRW